MHRHSLNELRIRRRIRVRAQARGTATCPRLSIFRSNTGIYAQLIDDAKGVTIACAGPKEVAAKRSGGAGTKTSAAAAVGTLIAERGKAAGITRVVFDRGSYRYHGRVKAVAEAARKGGLQF